MFDAVLEWDESTWDNQVIRVEIARGVFYKFA